MWGRGPAGFFPYRWPVLSEHLLNHPSLPSALWWRNKDSSPLLQCFKSLLTHHVQCSLLLSCIILKDWNFSALYFFCALNLNLHTFCFLNGGFINVAVLSSVAMSCPTLCNPTDRSRSGFPGPHRLPEFAQAHVRWIADAIRPSHPLSSPSPPAFNLSQHQDLSQRVGFLHQVTQVLKLQHQSFQSVFRVDFL